MNFPSSISTYLAINETKDQQGDEQHHIIELWVLRDATQQDQYDKINDRGTVTKQEKQVATQTNKCNETPRHAT